MKKYELLKRKIKKRIKKNAMNMNEFICLIFIYLFCSNIKDQISSLNN